MQDLQKLREELERQGKLSALQTLSESPEARALRGQLPEDALSDPAKTRAALERLLQSREGQALARQIRDAMRHG